MLTPPDDLADHDLSVVLASGWGLQPKSIAYAALGFGSHHWDVVDVTGRRWFLTADRIETAADLILLSAALRTARELRRSGIDFVTAPEPTTSGDVLVVEKDYAITLHRHIEQVASVGDPDVLGLIIRLHGATELVRGTAPVDDFLIGDRSVATAALNPANAPPAAGPYAARFRELMAVNGDVVTAAFARYDHDVARLLSADQSDWVITHGEPKPDNIMITDRGPMLIDWDTVRLAPAARDLWMIGEADPYTKITGRNVTPGDLELFRLRWALADLCSFGAWFSAPHELTPETEIGWRAVVDICENRLHRLSDRPAGRPAELDY